ncbi:MAG: Lrp/AsnC family transcriptional regulator [Promethearchaeota archaeon]
MVNEFSEDNKNEVFKIFNIDEDDLKILKIFQDTPHSTHVEVAKKIRKSQPAVGARVTKLERKHILATQKGVNFRLVNDKLYLLNVDLQTKDPETILEEIEHCPFVINCFKKSGAKNLTILFAGTNMKKLEMIVDRHFRANPGVSNVETSFIVEVMKDLVLPVNWEFLLYEDIPCGETCCKLVKREG